MGPVFVNHPVHEKTKVFVLRIKQKTFARFRKDVLAFMIEGHYWL